MVKKHHTLINFIKILTLLLTAVYPVLMTCLSGAGLIYNRSSYGSSLTAVGVFLIISGAAMTAGAILCLPRRSVPNVLSVILSLCGLALCLAMLFRLTSHADRAGWSDIRTMTPVSDMYRSRILPVTAPACLSSVLSLIQLFSYEETEERRLKRKKREEEENRDTPKILG